MQKYTFSRDIPVEDGYDFVVAGGGPGGYAAPISAARAISTGQTACNLNTKTLIESLRAQDCILPQDELSEMMTKKLKAVAAFCHP